jgi:hypothetical protein
MHWIPDVPKIIEDQIERENLITQRALWEATPEIKTTTTTSNIVGLAPTSHETNYTPVILLESILINETTNHMEHRSTSSSSSSQSSRNEEKEKDTDNFQEN